MADIEGLRRDIGIMVSKGAPEEDLDKYLSLHGVSARDLTDPYRATAHQEMAAEREATGIPRKGYSDVALHGATQGFSDEILGAMGTPVQMWKRGTWNPAEAYRHSVARERVELEDAQQRTGGVGKALEIGGSIVAGTGAAKGGATLFRSGMSAPKAVGAGLAEGATWGGLAGVGEGEGLSDTVDKAATGAGIGTALSGGVIAASPVVKRVAAPISAYFRPERWADKQVARGVLESGRGPQQIEQGLASAAAEGQGGVYTLGDEMDNPGQRLLSTVARAPGPGRTKVVDQLDRRQADQGRRVANQLAEGFDAPLTAAQTKEAATAARTTASDRNYNLARNSAGEVNVTPATDMADEFLRPGATRVMSNESGIRDDSIEGIIRKARSYLTDGNSQITDFQAAFRAKQEIDNLISRATPQQQRELIPISKTLDEQLAAASQPYAHARDTHRAMSQPIEAVDAGRAAATRGRTEDTIPAFRKLSPEAQATYRAGYVDPLIEKVQGGSFGVNKARDFTSDAFRDEAAAIAPMRTEPRMQRQLGRENKMFETRFAATGGSKTADNIADQKGLTAVPSILGNLATGGGLLMAMKNLYGAASNATQGLTPTVRSKIADILLQTANQAPQVGHRMAEATKNEINMRNKIAAALRGSAVGAETARQSYGRE